MTIELTEEKSDTNIHTILVNVRQILYIKKSSLGIGTPVTKITFPQEAIFVRDSYAEVKAKIAEALGQQPKGTTISAIRPEG